MIFTNGPRDTVRAAFLGYTQKACGVLLACPFFSNSSLVRDTLKRGCSVKLIVRLTAATRPDELAEVLNLHAAVRYFTSSRFHAKLYIFGNDVALVGSANLTDSGVQSNREVCVGVEREDPRFDQLVQLFQAYWDDAQVLDREALGRFRAICNANKISGEAALETEIKNALGDVSPGGGVLVGGPVKSREQVYLDDYKRGYQGFLLAFRKLKGIYGEFNQRQQPEDVVPLRIEIDQFFSFIRETFAQGDTYQAMPLLHGPELDRNARTYIERWFAQRWRYLDENIPRNYANISMGLGTPEKIASADYDGLLDSLMVCHAFRETLRFHKGAEPALRRDFMRDNTQVQVKKTLTYLLFGQDDFISRMGNCIFNPEYALSWFGRSCVQETFGWVNSEDIPICNGRTVKSMRFLGFDVETFGG